MADHSPDPKNPPIPPPKFQEETPEALYPIREVALRTGANPVTLRAWERRYGLIKPRRTPKGHRLYSEADINLVHRIITLLSSGLAISQIRPLLEKPEATSEMGEAMATTTWKEQAEALLEAIHYFNENAIDAIYHNTFSLYPTELTLRRLLQPTLDKLRQDRERLELGAAEEGFFKNYLKYRLGARIQQQNPRNSGPRLLFACLPNDHNEMELLINTFVIVSHNYRALLLGENIPLTQIAQAASKARFQGVVLQGNVAPTPHIIESELPELVQKLSIPLFIMGQTAARFEYEISAQGAIPLPMDFQPLLEKLNTQLVHQD
ncbi:MerR family transcriptional regulator [Nitrosococcus wardiae]|uniref:MerR family transcriptional regulator n=1 Tax=Nitrosococcus wardiae TaxID=1814290 RepID=A0A4P7BXX7_9GAMM|nr:MerR family transcriptional regulator [Nitrosococcus wardiae]QBQ54059.1 MerR family transcriptional regulator [Nitrosococcus wardiae]